MCTIKMLWVLNLMISAAMCWNSMMIVPTGVGASIGGYAGDALPSARLLASISDKLITHPNVVNGAMLYWPMDNVLYVEGFALDEFAAGRLSLRPMIQGGHKIGLLLDDAIENDLRTRHLQVADAASATLGLNVHACVTTKRPVGVELQLSSESGASWGSIRDIPALIDGAKELVDKFGCTAIAAVMRFPEEDNAENASELFDAYRRGEGVDAIAGAEALISHTITKALNVPCAHAPAFDAMEVENDLSPKAAAEELGYTFLPCVLANLHRAPKLIGFSDDKSIEDITFKDIDAVVVPSDCLGGPAVLSLMRKENHDTIIIAVDENKSSMKVTPRALFGDGKVPKNIYTVHSYMEAAGLITAKKLGLNIESLGTRVTQLSVK